MRTILLLLFSIIPFFVFSQDPIYNLPEPQKSLIKNGGDCLREQESNCFQFFEDAILKSKKAANDSILAQTYFEICNTLDFTGKSEDHISYAIRGLELDGKKHPLVTNRLLRELGYAYSKNGTVDSLIPVYNRAIYWAEFVNDSSEIAISRIRLASSYRRIGNIKKSIELLLNTRIYVQASKDIHRESGLLFTLANAYSSNGDHDMAIANYEEAAEGFLLAEDERMYAASLINLSMAANDCGKHEIALEKIPEAIEIFKKNDPNSVLYCNTHLGYAYYLNGELDKAIDIYKESLAESIRLENKILENLNRKQLAQAYLDKRMYAAALQESTIAYNDEKERGVSDAYLTGLKIHAKALGYNNKNDEAIIVYEEYITVKDSIFSDKKEREIANMREYYETEKKEAQIELLEKNITLSNLQKTIYGIGMLSFIAIAGLLIFGFSQRIKKNKIEREKQEEIYKKEIAFKQKELTSQTLHLVQKNTFIQELKENLEKIKNSPELFKVEYRRIIMLLKKENAEDKDWKIFKSYFAEVHNDFDKKLLKLNKTISEKEIRLASFIRMNLTTKEIATLLNVLPESVLKSKYRLKKKLDLEKEKDLNEYLNNL